MQGGTSPKYLIITGFVLIEVCLYTMTKFSPLSAQGEILRTLYIRGLAMAFLFVPINSSILSLYSGIHLGQVAGLLNLFRQIGGSAGIALVATLLNSRSHQNYSDLSNHANALNPQVQNFMRGLDSSMGSKLISEIGMNVSSAASLRTLYGKVQNQVFMLSFLQLIYIMMFLMMLTIIPIWRLKVSKGPVKVVNEH